MDLSNIRQHAEEAIEKGDGFCSLVFPVPWKRPPKFPRGDLMGINCDGDAVRSFEAKRLLKWLDWAESELAEGDSNDT